MKTFKKPGSQNWHYRFTIRGREYKGSTGTANKAEAEKIMRREWTLAEASAGPSTLPTVRKMRDADIERARLEGTSEAHIERSINVHWNNIQRFWGDSTRYDQANLNAYIKSRSPNVKNQTLARELTTLKRGLRMFKITGPDEWPKLPTKEEDDSRKGHFHGVEKTREWLQALDGHAFDTALVMLLTGIRMWELSRTDATMIEGDIFALPKHVTKAKKRREIGLTPRVREALLRSFPFDMNHQRTFKRAAKEVGIAGSNFHTRDMRTTFATVGDESGDPRGVDLVMGHGEEVEMRYQRAHRERVLKIARYVDAWLGEVTPCVSAHPSYTPQRRIFMQPNKRLKLKGKGGTGDRD